MLNKLIAEREEHFQHALSESAEQSLIAHLKNDIGFLKEKKRVAERNSSCRKQNFKLIFNSPD
ncbi:MAG: hypothetical protein ABI855_01925 [Bacteroidota bacterium]